MRDLTDCPNCTEYVTKRLSTVLRLWHEETGRKVWVGSFLVGLHARHEAGLPILAVGR